VDTPIPHPRPSIKKIENYTYVCIHIYIYICVLRARHPSRLFSTCHMYMYRYMSLVQQTRGIGVSKEGLFGAIARSQTSLLSTCHMLTLASLLKTKLKSTYIYTYVRIYIYMFMCLLLAWPPKRPFPTRQILILASL